MDQSPSRPVRMLHLLGGLRSVVAPDGRWQILPKLRTEDAVIRQINDYSQAYADIQRATGKQCIGVEFWNRLPYERNDVEWHVVCDWPGPEGCHAHQWSNMRNGTGALTAELAFNAGCISSQLFSSYACLKMLSDGYHNALEFHYPKGPSSNFSSIKTLDIFRLNQLFLYNLTSCIDFIFRFAGRHILQLGKGIDSFRGASQAALDAGLIDAVVRADLDRIYNLRNLAMHNVPLEKLAGSGASISKIGLDDSLSLSVKMPVPHGRPADARDQLFDLKTFSDWEDFRANQTEITDLLEFAERSMTTAVSISRKILALSPVTPRILTITDADVIECIEQ